MAEVVATKLQVQIAVYGHDGMSRLLEHSHPQEPGVQWLVSWQVPDGDCTVPQALLARDDFDVIVNRDRGVAKNRNHALDVSDDAPWCLLSDDDVDYEADALRELMGAFDEYPEADIICCRYLSRGSYTKNYGEGVFTLNRAPKGWYAATIEMAFRRESCKGLRFNENFGPGSGRLISGEDSVWFCDMMRKGLKGVCVPIDLCSHDGETSGERLARDKEFVKAQGAIIIHSKPLTWLPRLLLYAYRSPKPYFWYLYHSLRGVIYAVVHRIYKNS
ncbi:MAG: glycosyltransferase [Muribaculaceae bacterium]|nr:glycosyltransferase [Muribaculaceae bacterium]